MQRISPLVSTGLMRLEASITPPDAAPAPMTVWISSMNRIAPGCFLSSVMTPFRRFSKSPRYFEKRSEEHTSELQSQSNLVCRLLLEKKKAGEKPCLLEYSSM